ncbi:MAG: hypothetical protein CL990_06615 [Euryarchaeota archaeon]|nr:hypothetical protein [Euryarchaeota archaeon]
MGHVLVLPVQGEDRLVQLPHLVPLQQVQEVSTSPCQGKGTKFPQLQVVRVLRVVKEGRDQVVQQVLLQGEQEQQV